VARRDFLGALEYALWGRHVHVPEVLGNSCRIERTVEGEVSVQRLELRSEEKGVAIAVYEQWLLANPVAR
jgi:hypothetical protein